jgi:DNA-3-methyladenine glycosylase I
VASKKKRIKVSAAPVVAAPLPLSGLAGDGKQRCHWAKSDAMVRYHDEEWGVPLHDDRALFEFLILEGHQAGLSWETVLRKREAYREAFDGFEVKRVAAYDKKKIRALLKDARLIRNRLKMDAAVSNARAFLNVQREFGSFDEFIWRFVGGAPLALRTWKDGRIPATSIESDAMSKELKNRGFRFVGSTICYAMMQAVGMVNDHAEDCFRYLQL